MIQHRIKTNRYLVSVCFAVTFVIGGVVVVHHANAAVGVDYYGETGYSNSTPPQSTYYTPTYSTVQSTTYGQFTTPTYAPQYWWGGRWFSSFDEMVNYVRFWLSAVYRTPLNTSSGSSAEGRTQRINVLTERAVSITDTTATLEGTIEFDRSEDVTVWFEYGPGSSLRWNTGAVTVSGDRRDERSFARRLLGLSDNERYSFRAVGEDERGNRDYGRTRTFTTERRNRGSDPDATTFYVARADITDHEALLRGSVNMKEFEDGLVFFVYGEDADQVEEITDEYDSYSDIDEDGDDLQKVIVDRNHNRAANFEYEVRGLDSDSTIYYAIGVEYEDDDGDLVLVMGDVLDFDTER